MRLRATSFLAVLHQDAASGAMLLAMAIAAMIAANSPLAPFYHRLFHSPLLGFPAVLPDLSAWIDKGLMAIFFFAIGLEIKREALVGDLASAARRRLPVLAALAGMIVPALIYLACAWGRPELRSGWAIPTSTDIAFATGVMGLSARGLPPSLRLFLLGVAVVDDVGALTIIALFYHEQTAALWLVGSVLVLAAMVALNRADCRGAAPYLAAALLLWVCVLHSGINPAVAGVAAALTVPLRTPHGIDHIERNLAIRWERRLEPWCGWVILPLFALANAGVPVGQGGGAWWQMLLQPLPLAVIAGLVIGKPLAIYSAVVLTARAGIAKPPRGGRNAQIWGVSTLTGIGFTMSLFIAALAFPHSPQRVEDAKLGVLAGSAISALAGYLILRLSTGRRVQR